MADISAPWWASGAFAIAGGLTQPCIAAVSAALERNRRKRVIATKLRALQYPVERLVRDLQTEKLATGDWSRYDRLATQLDELVHDDLLADFFPGIVWLVNDMMGSVVELLKLHKSLDSKTVRSGAVAAPTYDVGARTVDLIFEIERSAHEIGRQFDRGVKRIRAGT